MAEMDPVLATRKRAALRGEWLRLRAQVLVGHMRDDEIDVPAVVAQIEHAEALLAGEHTDHLSDVSVIFDLDQGESLIIECLAAIELPGGACPAILELGGKLTSINGKVVVDAVIAAIAAGDPDIATALLARLSPEGRLRRNALVEIAEQDRPRRLSSIRLAAGMLEHLNGQLPAGPYTRWVTGPPVDGDLHPQLVDIVAAALEDHGEPLVVIVGPSGSGRAGVVQAAANRSDMPVLRVDAELLAQTGEADTITRLARDARLARGVILAEGLQAANDAPGGQQQGLARRRATVQMLATANALVAFTADGDDPTVAAVDRPLVRVTTGLPDEATRVRLWSGTLADDDLTLIARTFALGPRAIRHAAATARVLAAARTGEPVARASAADARQAIHAVVAATGTGQEYGAESVYRPRLEDLVLSAENRELLDELITRMRQRRRVLDEWGFRAVVGQSVGVAALFHGPPGTGKSMAAHAVATHLGVECFRVDLSQVISKWVGETEKHLSRVFDTAERSDALLLFDEADALFTKRTEVKSSNDRYANLEVNYLLQRIESFPGLAVLTTNHIQNLDTAFMRRLSVQVKFDLPDIDERELLWRRKLPPAAPLGADVSLRALADKYPMTGARIRNAAVRAAFYAADAGTAISQDHLVKAVLAEYTGAGAPPGGTRHLE